jgi:hypothetical protein
MTCHSQIWSDSPLLEPIRESWRTGKPVTWRRVHDMPDFVYFNHSIHVKKGISCVSCHGRVDEMPMMYRAKSLSMSFCVNCHRNPQKFIRPKEHVYELAWQSNMNQAKMGAQLVEAYHVLPAIQLTNCSICHH